MESGNAVADMPSSKDKPLIVPLDYKTACAFVDKVHRHHQAPQGHKFSVGLVSDGILVAAAMCGRPVNRHYDDGYTLEVTRVASSGFQNACSILYGACYRAAKAMGYSRLCTYTMVEEPGISPKAFGFSLSHQTHGGNWASRGRPSLPEHLKGQKNCWVITVKDEHYIPEWSLPEATPETREWI